MQTDPDAIERVSGRRIMLGGMFYDFLNLIYVLLSACTYFNLVRFNIYAPEMMQPLSDWSPYWRIFGAEGFLLFMPFFNYLLVFYRSALLLIFNLIISMLAFGFGLYAWIALIVDWTQCKTTPWCPCIVSWTITGGAFDPTYCDPSDVRASHVFVANFFLFMCMLIMVVVMALVAVWIHAQYETTHALWIADIRRYFLRNQVYDITNIHRNLLSTYPTAVGGSAPVYASMNSEMGTTRYRAH